VVYSLVLLNGGVGARVAAGRPKQFIVVNGIPILVYSLVAADAVDTISQIVLNYPRAGATTWRRSSRTTRSRPPSCYVEAGRTRHESVGRMLPLCENDHVIIHESARPLVTAADFHRIIAHEHRDVSYMLDIPFTVAPVEPATKKSPATSNANTLRNVQLPQKFSKETLVAAHAYAAEKGVVFTRTPRCARSPASTSASWTQRPHFKVTTRVDVQLAGYLLGKRGQR